MIVWLRKLCFFVFCSHPGVVREHPRDILRSEVRGCGVSLLQPTRLFLPARGQNVRFMLDTARSCGVGVHLRRQAPCTGPPGLDPSSQQCRSLLPATSLREEE